MIEQITGLLLSRKDKLAWKGGILSKSEYLILNTVLCPEGVPVKAIPEQKPFSEMKHRSEANPIVLEAARKLAWKRSKAGNEKGGEWGFVKAYETGLKKMIAHLGLQEPSPEVEVEYVTRDERRSRSVAWWVD
ncbi:MAG: hypothetical protein AAB669_00315 [Patescibacteria group bacterium]